MTHTSEHDQRRNALLAKAVKAGKLVNNSKAYHMVSDLYDSDPVSAERVVRHLAESPLPTGPFGAQEPPAPQEYPPNWLSSTERARVAQANSGEYQSITSVND